MFCDNVLGFSTVLTNASNIGVIKKKTLRSNANCIINNK